MLRLSYTIAQNIYKLTDYQNSPHQHGQDVSKDGNIFCCQHESYQSRTCNNKKALLVKKKMKVGRHYPPFMSVVGWSARKASRVKACKVVNLPSIRHPRHSTDATAALHCSQTVSSSIVERFVGFIEEYMSKGRGGEGERGTGLAAETSIAEDTCTCVEIT